jgi:hypothetical protein
MGQQTDFLRGENIYYNCIILSPSPHNQVSNKQCSEINKQCSETYIYFVSVLWWHVSGLICPSSDQINYNTVINYNGAKI